MTRSALLVLLTAVLLLGGGVLGYFFWSDSGPPPVGPPGGSPSFDGDSGKLRQTAFVPTLDTPIPEGKSAVWCASFQMAWDKLRDGVVKGPVVVTNADAVCERLNKNRTVEADLPPDGFYAAAGFEDDGIRQTIRDEMARRFPDAPAPQIGGRGDKGSVLAYAYLEAAVKFRQQYFENPRDFQFSGLAGKAGTVRSFGVWPHSGKDAPALQEQVEILYDNFDRRTDTVTKCALDLDRNSRTTQVVIARGDRKGTLAEILAETDLGIQGHVRSAHKYFPDTEDKLDETDTLLVPAMRWKVRHSFRELLGPDKLLSLGSMAQPMRAAEQTIAFHLDARGAGVESQSRIETKSAGMRRQFRFDGPFLLYLKRRGGEHPFFVMWVENAELLLPARP
jgi:hypothetical protein